MSRRVNRDLRAAVSDYSLQASYAWWWMAIISEMFFTWCVEYPIVPPLAGAYCWQDNKNYDWRAARKRNQTLLRNMIKLETHDKPALQQSKWPLLKDFWASVGQRHASQVRLIHKEGPLQQYRSPQQAHSSWSGRNVVNFHELKEGNHTTR